MIRAVAACLLVALVAACSSADPKADAPSSSLASSAPNGKDCGTFRQADQGTDPISATGLSCFTGALTARQPAHLVVTMLTTEGDPVMTTYEAKSDGSARVVTDSSRDRFAGGRTLTVEVCRGAQPARGVLTFAQCTEAQSETGSATTGS